MEEVKSENKKDQLEIDELTNRFFNIFTNKNGVRPRVSDIKDIFIAEGLIISNTEATPIIYDLDGFIAPRERILTNGTLTDFNEYEVSQETMIFGHIAQRFSCYEKSGNMNGKTFDTQGVKSIQLVRVGKKWKMSSVAWSDSL